MPDRLPRLSGFANLWILFCAFFSGFVRIGEAAVPGPPGVIDLTQDMDQPDWALPTDPQFVLSVGNPCGISNKLSRLELFPTGWHHLVETHATKRQQCALQGKLKAISRSQDRLLRSTLGHPAPLRPGSQHAGSWTGVLSFGDLPLKEIPIPWPDGVHSSGRVLISVGVVGGLELSIATVYCPPKGPTYPQAQKISEALLTPITEQLVFGRQGARAIMGDFNCSPGSLQQMKLWQSQGWVELQDLCHGLFAVAPKMTCKNATRPDQIWLSPELAALVNNVGTWSIWPDHETLLASIRIGQPPKFSYQWRLPGRISWDLINRESWISDDDLGPLFPTNPLPEGGNGLSDSSVRSPEVSTHSLTQAFSQWSSRFESRVTQHLSTPVAKADKSFYGRGSITKPQLRKTSAPVPKHHRQGEVEIANGFLNRSTLRWFQQLRRLQSYLHAARSARAAENYLSRVPLWRSILMASGFKGNFQQWWPQRPVRTQGPPAVLPLNPPDAVVAEMIFQDYLQNYRRYEHWQSGKRRISCQSKLHETSKGLFACTRKTVKDAIDCLEDSLEQTIEVIDTRDNIVAVPQPFPTEAIISWTLQGEPVTVKPCAQGYHVDSDLVLASGQVLACQTMVHDTDVIHQRLRDLWTPFWSRHLDVPTDRWTDIVDFARGHVPSGNIDLPPLTVTDWHRAVAKFKPSSASGPCGWHRSDVLNLTPSQIQAILDFYGLIEQHACWPQQFTAGHIHCLQKKQRCKTVSDYRPITVTSLYYRIYAGLRAEQILAALTPLATQHQCGYMQGKHSADIWAFVSMCIEVAAKQQSPLFGWVADLEKAFNTLARIPIFDFLIHLGVPSWFIKVWRAFLADFRRYFIVRNTTGEPLTSVTGFPEGCPLSCCAMVAVNIVWHAWQTSQVPRSLVLSYVDNLEAVCDNLVDLETRIGSLRSFCTLLDLRLDENSFFVWSSSESGRRELRVKGYKISLSSRDLGGQVVYCKQLRNKIATDRMKGVHEFFGKLQNFLQVLWPRALYACEAVVIGGAHFNHLRSGLLKSLRWDRAGASPFVRVGLLHTSHDPEWYQLTHTVKLFRRMCSVNRIAHDWWSLYLDSGHGQTYGPFGKILALLADLNLCLDSNFRLWFSDNGYVNLLTVPFEFVEIMLRRRFHQNMATQVSHRPGFSGLDGCDVGLTTSADHSFLPSEVEQLMIIRDGAFISNEYKSKFDTRVSSICAWCQQEDTRLHKYETCCKYDTVRAKHAALFTDWQTFPDCFKLHGLVPENPWQEIVWEAMIALDSRLTDFAFAPRGDVLHIFTDGTCSHPSVIEESLGAWAVVVAGRGTLAYGPLTGPYQTILRAEIMAVWSALLWIGSFTGDAHLWVDNETVVMHLRDLLLGHSVDKYAHADLWRCIAEALADTKATVFVHKVASHIDVNDSSSPLDDFCIFWNGQADLQAEVANQCRPAFFTNIWDKHLNFRIVWKRRVAALTAFQNELAKVDCNADVTFSDDVDETPEVSLIGFDRQDNPAFVSVQLVGLIERGGDFVQTHDAHFRQIAAKLASWIISQDQLAVSSRLVSIPEIYLGFRRFGNSGSPVSFVGGGVGTCYHVLTVAADMAFFRNILRHLLVSSGVGFSPDKLDLSQANVFVPQLAVRVGWPHSLEADVIRDVIEFAGNRPITSAQGFAKPWPF